MREVGRDAICDGMGPPSVMIVVCTPAPSPTCPQEVHLDKSFWEQPVGPSKASVVPQYPQDLHAALRVLQTDPTYLGYREAQVGAGVGEDGCVMSTCTCRVAMMLSRDSGGSIGGDGGGGVRGGKVVR